MFQKYKRGNWEFSENEGEAVALFRIHLLAKRESYPADAGEPTRHSLALQAKEIALLVPAIPVPFPFGHKRLHAEARGQRQG